MPRAWGAVWSLWPYVAGLVCALAEYSTPTSRFPAAVIVVLGERLGNRRIARVHRLKDKGFLPAR